MEKIKLNICSFGDSTNPKTWSGTPFNIYTELLGMDRLGNVINVELKRKRYIIAKVLSKVYYADSLNWQHGMINRYFCAYYAKKNINECNSKYTLHLGTLGLPFRKLENGRKNYLFCDSTWNLWNNNATNSKNTPQLLFDAERLEQESYMQMDHIFTISEYVKQNLISHYKIDAKKITVVGTGLGVIAPYFKAKDYSNGKILFVAKGRFEDKGGPSVIEAFKIASRINPNLELTIVGQDKYIEEINVKNIKTYGYVELRKLQELFNNSSLFLMPAVNEPWGLVYLEAMACKMPIVGLNKNSFPEISANGNNGFGLKRLDVNELAQVLVDAFSNPQKLEEMGSRAQEFCLRKFSWKKTVQKIIETIEVE